jgi:anti-sigma factor RsiW
MSHLGERLSALVDGELGGAERDRAYAHLASCAQCRAEAAQLRALKQKLRSLVEGAPAEAAMIRRLISMTGPGGPLPPRRRLLRVVPARDGGSSRRSTGPRSRRPRPAHRRRYVLLGTVSLLVGLGTAAFTAGGGGQAAPGPRITPPVELYSVEHAIITGEVPFNGPSARPAFHPSGSDASQP